jgi:hypothetical protein
MNITLTPEQVEIVYLALSQAQDRLTYESTDEEWKAYDDLMDLVIGR